MDNIFSDLYEEKLNQSNKLMDSLQHLVHVKGISKLKKLLVSERAFLQKLGTSGKQEYKHLTTTNLTHFEALMSAMLETDNCLSTLEPFMFVKGGITKRIVVDIVQDHGREWVKVTARNAKSLVMSCIGDTSYGSRTILEQARDFIECANQNQVLYAPPRVIFKFFVGVDSSLASKLRNLGIQVVGEIYQSSVNIVDSSDEESDKFSDTKIETELYSEKKEATVPICREDIVKLNLDTTALIAYVSDMTNGGTCLNFVQEPLAHQAQSENKVKVKECLDSLFDGKELYCCETAMSRFKEILHTVGGEKEKERAELLFKRINVVPDCISERVQNLKLGGQIKLRPQIVFGTGDSMQALTVSANLGFCRSARHQGVQLATYLHEPRALSEQASYISLSRRNENTVA